MRLLARLSLGLMTLGFAACSFGVNVDTDPGFSCRTNDDCTSGYFCLNADNLAEGAVSRCVSETNSPETCIDDDNDEFFAPGCTTVTAEQYDCDDTNRDINPGADEVCDGVDNDCDCTGDTNGDATECGLNDEGVDEDLPEVNCALQAGVCTGAKIACINGQYPIARCGEFGAYPETYENAAVETICDELDNNCNGQIDEGDCDCQLDNLEARECGVDTGECTRGVEVCDSNNQRTPCLSAVVLRACSDGTQCEVNADCTDGSDCLVQTCEADADCDLQPNGYCVEELVDVIESIEDDCVPGGTSRECPRSVCRYLEGVDECTTNDDCDAEGGEICVGGACQVGNVGRLAAGDICNGLDDDCNGTIDSPGPRQTCGRCPYNSLLINLARPVVNSTFTCIDRYEASRPDATGDSAGEFELYAASQAGVVPWTGLSPEDAAAACSGRAYTAAVGLPSSLPVATKRLCTVSEWVQGCGGITGLERLYPYAEGISQDAFEAGACVDSSRELDGPAVTGSAPRCCFAPNSSFPDSPTCDMVGNVAEWITDASSPKIAGGSYQDSDPGILSCGNGVSYPAPPDVESYEGIDTIGFRCCTLPQQP